MKLHWPVVERKLRRSVRRALEAKPALWRESRKYRRPTDRGKLRLFFWPVIFYLGLDGFHSSFFVVCAFYLCGKLFTDALNLLVSLYQSHELAVAWHLPIRDEDFFRRQVGAAVGESLWAWVGLCAYGAPLILRQAGFLPWLTAAFGIALQWLLFMALYLLVARYGLRWGALPGYVFYALAALAFFSQIILDRAEPVARVLAAALPFGWVHVGLWPPAGLNPWLGDVMVFAALGVTATLAWTWPWLRSTFLETMAPPPTRPELVADTPDMEEDVSEWLRARDSHWAVQSRDRVEKGALGVVADWETAGQVEALAARWFTAREQVVADFLLAEHIGTWTHNWTWSVYACVAVLALTLVPVVPTALLFLGALTSFFIGCPVNGGRWIGFLALWSGSRLVPLLAIYPVGYREVSRVFLKVNVLRILAWLPLGLLLGVAIGWRWGMPGDGLAFVLATVYVLLVAQPMAVATKFSGGTNDSQHVNLRRIGIFLAIGVQGLVFFLSAVIFFSFLLFVGEWPKWPFLLLGAALIPLALLFWWSYEWDFHRGRVDQFVAPRQS
jgi:hypothetical protein